MSREKYLVTVGLQDEHAAYLRLLLRRLAPSLTDRWLWGDESNADLVIVDIDSFVGRMARDRANGSGRRCAIVNAKAELKTNELRCPLPLAPESFVALLNEASGSANDPGQGATVALTDDFSDELAQFSDASDMSFHDSRPDYTSVPQVNGDAELGLDALLDRDKHADRLHTLRMEVRAGGTVESSDRISARSEARTEFKTLAPERAAPVDYHEDVRMRDGWPLRHFLDGDLIGGPSMLHLPGAPALSLDPKNRVCYSDAQSLQDLAVYCNQRLPVSRWRVLTTLELQQLRGSARDRPYSHLIWLSVWLGSHGKLASHLSPGADFRLTTQPNLDDGVAVNAAIVRALMTPGRIHEIVARSGAGMNEVIDLINAYDAIGWIEAKRYLPPIPEADKDKGLLGKLFRR